MIHHSGKPLLDTPTTEGKKKRGRLKWNGIQCEKLTEKRSNAIATWKSTNSSADPTPISWAWTIHPLISYFCLSTARFEDNNMRNNLRCLTFSARDLFSKDYRSHHYSLHHYFRFAHPSWSAWTPAKTKALPLSSIPRWPTKSPWRTSLIPLDCARRLASSWRSMLE